MLRFRKVTGLCEVYWQDWDLNPVFLAPGPPYHACPQGAGHRIQTILFSWPTFPCFEFPSPASGLIYPRDSFWGKVSLSGMLRHKYSHICCFHSLLTTLCTCHGPWAGTGALQDSTSPEKHPWADPLPSLEVPSELCRLLDVCVFLHSLSFMYSVCSIR